MKKLLLTLVALVFATFGYSQTNLLTNGGFEKWADGVADGWKSTTTASNGTVTQSTEAHTGSYSASLANATSNKRLGSVEYKLKAGTYTFSFYAKSASASVAASARPGYAPWNESAGKLGNYSYGDYVNNISSEWTLVSYEFTLTEATQVNLVVMNPKSTDSNTYADLLIDDASLTTSDGGIVDGGSTGGDTGGDVTPVEGAITVAEAHAAAVDTQATVQGTVYAVGASSFVIGDNTGYILHYGAADVKVGDNVTVSGKISSYGGFNQFSSAEVKVLSSGTAKYPEAKVLTGADMDAWITSPAIQYVQYTGKLTISGNYYNVTVEGASTAVGSIIKPSEALAAKMSNGNEYTFTGFAMYVSGTKYLNTALVDVKAAGEEVKLNDISNTLETAYTPEKCVELINDEKNDLSKQVYIKGKISQMPEGAISTSYGNATFYISSDGSESAQQFEIFRGYWFKGEKFTAEDQLKLGDEVVYYGSMTKYNETYETNAGATLVLLNGKDSADSGETPAEPESIANTAETAYTVAEAIAIINKENVDLTQEVYVKGIISKVESFNEKYGSITYWISEDGSETAQQFEVYGGLNKGGEKFAGIEDVAVGAEVIIKGKIKLYKETYEFDKNNELVSYIAPANDAISSIKAGKQQSIVDLSGRRVSKAVKGIYVVDGKKVVF